MPRSKIRREVRDKRASSAQREQDRMLRRRDADWRKRFGWTTVAVGAALFIVGSVGARTGVVVLPFDPHHIFSQVGGAALAIIGLTWALGR